MSGKIQGFLALLVAGGTAALIFWRRRRREGAALHPRPASDRPFGGREQEPVTAEAIGSTGRTMEDEGTAKEKDDAGEAAANDQSAERGISGPETGGGAAPVELGPSEPHTEAARAVLDGSEVPKQDAKGPDNLGVAPVEHPSGSIQKPGSLCTSATAGGTYPPPELVEEGALAEATACPTPSETTAAIGEEAQRVERALEEPAEEEGAEEASSATRRRSPAELGEGIQEEQ